LLREEVSNIDCDNVLKITIFRQVAARSGRIEIGA
jgi:hypothetical protein